jgi:hypothetical protein
VIEDEIAIRLHRESEVLISVLRSVARRRLMKTDNPSACAMVIGKCENQRQRCI